MTRQLLFEDYARMRKGGDVKLVDPDIVYAAKAFAENISFLPLKPLARIRGRLSDVYHTVAHKVDFTAKGPIWNFHHRNTFEPSSEYKDEKRYLELAGISTPEQRVTHEVALRMGLWWDLFLLKGGPRKETGGFLIVDKKELESLLERGLENSTFSSKSFDPGKYTLSYGTSEDFDKKFLEFKNKSLEWLCSEVKARVDFGKEFCFLEFVNMQGKDSKVYVSRITKAQEEAYNDYKKRCEELLAR